MVDDELVKWFRFFGFDYCTSGVISGIGFMKLSILVSQLVIVFSFVKENN